MQLAEQLAAHRSWKQILLTGVVLILLAARVPLLWRTGEFVAEDGWVFFADAWNHSFWETLLRPYAGYFHLLPRLLAELCSPLPLVAQPYAYALLGLGLDAVILSAFYLPSFRPVLASDPGRLTVVLFLALAPNAQNLGLLLGLHWYLAFGLVLILIAPFPERPAARIGASLLILLCAWSSPSALGLIPFLLFFWGRLREPAGRLKLGLLLGPLLVVAGLVAVARVTVPERTGVFQWTDLPAAVDRLVLRGWLGTGLLGPRVAGALAGSVPLLLDVFAGGVLAALLAVLWTRRHQSAIRAAALVLGAGVLMLLLSLTRTAYVAELRTLALPLHDRYLTAPTLLLYLGLGLVGASTASCRRAWFSAGVIVAGLLVWSLPGPRHWSRPAVWFHLRSALPAIGRLEAQYARDGKPASLYVPSDVPYWGPVLEKGGGVIVPPSVGLVRALDARPDSDGKYSTWLGRFSPLAGGPWIRHEAWGRLEFTGVERGRVFFRDPAGRLLFTSPLLYPRLWQLAGTEWTLIGGPPPHP